jgi:murein DD-endopeptidase MepM/ murein hydrolase activator NlpD
MKEFLCETQELAIGYGKAPLASGIALRAKPGQILCFPLETAAWRVSDPYGWRKDPFTGKKAFHRGVDLACAEGTPVLAALDGVVTAARRGAAYGNYVRLTHGDGQETLYAHMQYLYVRAGEVVAAGQRLGTAGQTGRATGAHLHFEFLTGGIRYDPSAALSLP